MADQLAGEVTELLQQLIRNQCVNDGRPESGDEVRSADLLARLPRGHRCRARRLRRAARPAIARRPHRRLRPDRAEPVPHGPHRRRAGHAERMGARSLRRRARRRRGVGPRRHRHAQPHRVDGGRDEAPRAQRLSAAGQLALLRRRRRGSRRQVGRRVGARPRARHGRRGLRGHRVGRARDGHPVRASASRSPSPRRA